MEYQAPLPAVTQEVVAFSKQCLVLFDDFSQHQPQWSEDQRAHFKYWIADLGVFENGHNSVEYRLRDHPDVLDSVTGQLHVLKINLEELIKIVSEPVQPQIQKREKSGPESFEIDGEICSYESPPNSEGSSPSSNSELAGEGHLEPNLSDGLKTVEDAIGRLNALSNSMRTSAKQPRTSEADLYEFIQDIDGAKINATEEFEKYASAVVAREIPSAEPFLKERLAMSISRRRNRFLYWKRYDKTANIYVKSNMSSELQAEGSNIEFRKLLPNRTASGSIKLSGPVRLRNEEDFPKPPEIRTKDSPFFCPICFILCPAEEADGDSWVQHITRDLKPYICVFDGCKTPQTAFDSFDGWIRHIKEEHIPPVWHCTFGSHEDSIKFTSQGLFEAHIREQHSTALNMAQLPIVSRMCMRLDTTVFTSCPFCSYTQDGDNLAHPSNQDKLQSHVSSHLLSLAILSFPPLATEDTSKSKSG